MHSKARDHLFVFYVMIYQWSLVWKALLSNKWQDLSKLRVLEDLEDIQFTQFVLVHENQKYLNGRFSLKW